MPAGCEFSCENEKCKCYKTGFTIKGIWPLGNIGLIINSTMVKINKTFRSKLIKLKDEGRKHACISLPNVDKIPIEGYRFSLWCENCHCLWEKDVFFTEEERSKWEDKNIVPEDWSQNVSLSYECPQCKGHLKSFDTVINEGITCPECKQPLTQNRWFCNERKEK